MSELPNRKRILLGQLAANGDCLYATAVARQIKVDYPGCHLTWAIGAAYRSVIEGNPDVDSVWEIADYAGAADNEGWKRFKREALERKRRGEFDEIFLTQIYPDHLELWVGSVRGAIFRAYPHPVTVDSAPVVRLTPDEVENVRQFAEAHGLAGQSDVILFECGPRSQQSFVTPQFALEVAEEIVAFHPTVAVVLSSSHSFTSPHPNIVDGSELSVRENAELTKYCSLLVGASSGITWIATSDWAKPLPTLQLVRPDLTLSNSLVWDFKRRGADTSNVIEMSSYSKKDVCDCIGEILMGRFGVAKEKWDQKTPFRFEHYKHTLYFFLLRGMIGRALVFYRENVREHGRAGQFAAILVLQIGKCLVLMLPKTILKLKRFVARR